MPSSAVLVGEAIFLLVCIFGFWYWYNRNKEQAEEKERREKETYRGGVYSEIKLKCDNEGCPLKGEVQVFHDITPQELVEKLNCPSCTNQREIISQTKKP